MKKRNALLATIACLSIFAMASCSSADDVSSSGSASSNNPTSENSNTSSESSSTIPAEEQAEKSLIASYSSPANLAYMNMRPTYNYYITTYSFETLNLYDDNTYSLTYSSTCYSGIVMSEEGSEVSGSERENSVQIFYGNYSSSVNALDEDCWDVSLEVANRAVVNSDTTYFADTAQWNDTMATNTGYETAAEYLASVAFEATTLLVSNTTYSFDYFDIRPLIYTYDDDGNLTGYYSESPEIGEVSTDTQGLVCAYVSPGSISYMNMRPSYNYYMLSMAQEQILLYEDGSYELNHFASTFSGVTLSEEGSEASGSERINYGETYYGEYTSSVNALDEDSLDITLGAPSKYTISYNQIYYLDTENWTDSMTTAVSTDETTYDGASYLAAVSLYSEASILASSTTNSFDYDSTIVDTTRMLG